MQKRTEPPRGGNLSAYPAQGKPKSANGKAMARPSGVRYLARVASSAALATILLASCASAPQSDLGVRLSATETEADGFTRVYPLGDRKVAIVGTMNPDGTLTAESVDWFTNWQNGWTEARFFAAGTVRVDGTGAGAKLTAVEPLILQSTESARIRYRDSIIAGDEAAQLADRRLLRAETAALVLQNALNGREFRAFNAKKSRDRAESFDYVAGQYLFPERYGYPEGVNPSPKNDQNRARGEGFDWDTAYTATLDPRLAEVRNTGTLWRDWEECAELIYFIYVLER